jgi:hypothetical protein
MKEFKPCTCHISELRCKCEECTLLIEARKIFKTEVCELIMKSFLELKYLGYDRKKCIRSLRRELNHKNELQYDIFDQVAQKLWND